MNVEKLQAPNSKLQRSSKSQAPKTRTAMRGLFIILAGGLLCVATVVAWLRPSDPEPEYEGIKLSQWIRFNGRNRFGGWHQSELALQHMGDKAVPWMLKWLREPTFRELKIDVKELLEDFYFLCEEDLADIAKGPKKRKS
jgi:hypothetical protein